MKRGAMLCVAGPGNLAFICVESINDTSFMASR